jgi:hypothetical protein
MEKNFIASAKRTNYFFPTIKRKSKKIARYVLIERLQLQNSSGSLT